MRLNENKKENTHLTCKTNKKKIKQNKQMLDFRVLIFETFLLNKKKTLNKQILYGKYENSVEHKSI